MNSQHKLSALLEGTTGGPDPCLSAVRLVGARTSAETPGQWTWRNFCAHLQLARDLLGGQCSVCGTTERLHFDHIDPTTQDFYIRHAGGGMRLRKFYTEVNKCQLLCVRCHAVKTREDRSKYPREAVTAAWKRAAANFGPRNAKRRRTIPQGTSRGTQTTKK